MKTQKLIKHLKKHNCILLREGSKHSVWINITNGKQTTVPRHKEISDLLARKICQQLNIPFIK